MTSQRDHRPTQAARIGILSKLVTIAICHSAVAMELSPHDVVVGDTGRRAIFHVDPLTGDRTILSGLGVGTGTSLQQPRGVVVDRWGQIYVADPDVTRLRIIRIDPINGNRTLVSGGGRGSGLEFVSPFALALDSQGELYVTDRGTDRDLVFHVDIRTGDRTVVSSESVGSGQNFGNPIAMAIDAADSLLVADQVLSGVFRVDPTSGNRTAVSSSSMGVGPAIATPLGIDVAADGFILISAQSGGFGGSSSSIIQADPVSGNRQAISSSMVGSGPDFVDIRGLAIDSLQSIYAVDEDLDALFSVNRNNGARTIISDALHGSGTTFLTPDPIATVGSLELAGDYNDSGVVDAADYTVWRDRLASSLLLPGDVTPGLVSAEDYAVWRDNFGRTAAGLAGTTVIPEPAGSALLALCVWFSILWHRTRSLTAMNLR